jgi:hypothetical protein
MDLQSIHEVIFKRIQDHCAEIKAVNQTIGMNHPSSSLYSNLEDVRCMGIGGLCSLLATLNESILSPGEISFFVEGLEKLDYRHFEIAATIANLKKR